MAPSRVLLAALCGWRASGLTALHGQVVQPFLQSSLSDLRLREDGRHFERAILAGHDLPAADSTRAPLRELVITEMSRRYASRPPEERWPELLARATAYPEDPCDADLLSTYGWNAGFASGVSTLMGEVALAVYFGRTVATCHPINQEYGSFFDLWQNPVRYCNRSELCTDKRQYAFDPSKTRTPWGFSAIFWGGCLNSLECELNMTAKSPWLTPAQRHPGIFPEFRSWSKRYRHFIHDAVFRIAPKHREMVNRWVRIWGPPVRHTRLCVPPNGVSAGRLLWVSAGSLETRYFRACGEGPGCLELDQPLFGYTFPFLVLYAVYLASDDWPLSNDFASQLLAAAPSATLLMKRQFQYPGRNGGHALVDSERTILLGELQILRNATVFVGTASSSIGRLVYFLRTPQEGEDTLSLSVDEGGDWFSRFC